MIFAFEGGRREDTTEKWKRRRWHRGVSETFFKIHHGFIFEKQINQFDQNKSSALSIVLNFGRFLFDLYNNAPFSYFDVWLRLCIVSQYLPADFEDLSHLCRWKTTCQKCQSLVANISVSFQRELFKFREDSECEGHFYSLRHQYVCSYHKHDHHDYHHYHHQHHYARNMLVPIGVTSQRQRAKFIVRIYRADGLPR